VTALGFKFALTAMLPPVGYVTVLDKYGLFCFMFMSLGTSIKAVYPHYYFNMTDTSVLYAKPQSFSDEQDLIDADSFKFT
jgi:hypothetical protein